MKYILGKMNASLTVKLKECEGAYSAYTTYTSRAMDAEKHMLKVQGERDELIKAINILTEHGNREDDAS